MVLPVDLIYSTSVIFRSVPSPRLYNVPVLAVPTLNMMATQSSSLEQYQEGDQQVGMIHLTAV